MPHAGGGGGGNNSAAAVDAASTAEGANTPSAEVASADASADVMFLCGAPELGEREIQGFEAGATERCACVPRACV